VSCIPGWILKRRRYGYGLALIGPWPDSSAFNLVRLCHHLVFGGAPLLFLQLCSEQRTDYILQSSLNLDSKRQSYLLLPYFCQTWGWKWGIYLGWALRYPFSSANGIGEGQLIPRTILMLALLRLSSIHTGWGWGFLAGWVLPCPPSLLTHRQGHGTRDKGQPLQISK
jgi:hypothetical protein